MNIFVLDRNPNKIAKHYCRLHLGKLMLECCQILRLTKRQHNNSEWIPWANSNKDNYNWLLCLGKAMYKEWLSRGYNRHKSGEILLSTESGSQTVGAVLSWPQVMPEQYKSNCPIRAYRKYYAEKLKDFKKRGLL